MEGPEMTITPPRELVQQWENEALELFAANDTPTAIHIANRAAQWGADQELEACCELMDESGLDGSDLMKLRRPKPPSLKKQAIKALLRLAGCSNTLASEDAADAVVIRRALEALPDDRT
jgi:hypothetical protein